MVKCKLCLVAALALLLSASGANAAFWLYATDFETVGVMDEQVNQVNAIDREEASNAKTLTQFKADVAAAYAADMGGVCTWGRAWGFHNDSGSKLFGLGGGASGRGYNYFDSHGSSVTGEYTKILYGTSQAKAIQAVPTRCLEIWSAGYPGLYTAVSGPSYISNDAGDVVTPNANGAVVTPETNYWNGDPDDDNTRETLTFTSLVGGETLQEIGLVLLSSSSAQTVQVWVDYADMTSSAVRVINIAGGTTVDDVFVHFAAGSSPIVALHWDSDISRPPIGDLGIIMTPEPGTMALLALGGLALIRRRR